MFDHPPQEKPSRSWLYVAALTAAIYGTVPFARRLQGWVAEHWGREAFTYLVYGVLAACAVWACAWWYRRRATVQRRSLLALAAVFGAYGVQAYSLDVSPEEAFHLVEYGLLSLLIFRALGHRVLDPTIHLSALVVATMVGVGDELIQWFVPKRFWGWGDIGLNATAAALMQAGLAFGIRPAWVVRPVAPASAALLCRLTAALAAIVLACASNTPPRMAWLREHAPLEAIRRIDDIMIEYGFCFRHPEAGRVKSRLREAELRAFDAAHGAEVAAELDRYQGHSGYDRFFRDHTAHDDPFLYEARVRLFRRDYHIRAAKRHRLDTEKLTHHATIAFREQQILDTYFSNAVARSGYRLEAGVFEAMAALADRSAPYATPVSESLICAFTERQLRGVLLAALLAALGAAIYYGRRSRPHLFSSTTDEHG